MSDSTYLIPIPGVSLPKDSKFNEDTIPQLNNALNGFVNCNLKLSVSIEKLIGLVEVFSNIIMGAVISPGNLKGVSDSDVNVLKNTRDKDAEKVEGKDGNELGFIRELISNLETRFENLLLTTFNATNIFSKKNLIVQGCSEAIQAITHSFYNMVQSGAEGDAGFLNSNYKGGSNKGLSNLPAYVDYNPLTSQYLSVANDIANKSDGVFNLFFNNHGSFPGSAIYTPVSKDPRGIRNNNPGNLNFAKQKGATLEHPGGRFAKFESAYDGIAAIGNQLLRYYDGKTTGRKLQTLNDIIYTWAPPKDNNDSEAYVAVLAKKMSVDPAALLNLRNPTVLTSLMEGVISHENGRNPYSNEIIQAAAKHVISPTVNHQTHIYITGVSDPASVGDEVEKRQTNIYSRYAQMTIPGIT